MTGPLRSSPAVAGHPGITWSIVLRAHVASAVDPATAAERLRRAWPTDGAVGPVPSVGSPGEPAAALDAAANERYPEDGPFVRVLVSPAQVLVAAHHAVLDGLGLVAVLGAVLDVELGSTARGSGAPRSRGGLRRLAYPMARVGEAIVRPPARIARGRDAGDVDEAGNGPGRGDHLVAAGVLGSTSTAGLVAAAVDAVRAWNAESRAPASRVVVAVGASSRSGGGSLAIGRSAAWFRIAVPPGASADGVRDLLQRRGTEPPPATTVLRAARASGLAARLERRTGSTLLVSHLGGLVPEDAVSGAEFYPAAHGRSGLAVGAVGSAGRTELTVRARRADFTEAEVRRFLDLVAARVAASDARPRAED